ncbi:MAG: hypothetical protein L3J81_03420, partial [Thermoplasmata archaeon]|nr:hypothetical protein [Thermoplasmata archaeon]
QPAARAVLPLRDWRFAGSGEDEARAALTRDQQRPWTADFAGSDNGGTLSFYDPGSARAPGGPRSVDVGFELDCGIPKLIVGEAGADANVVVWLLPGGAIAVEMSTWEEPGAVLHFPECCARPEAVYREDLGLGTGKRKRT